MYRSKVAAMAMTVVMGSGMGLLAPGLARAAEPLLGASAQTDAAGSAQLTPRGVQANHEVNADARVRAGNTRLQGGAELRQEAAAGRGGTIAASTEAQTGAQVRGRAGGRNGAEIRSGARGEVEARGSAGVGFWARLLAGIRGALGFGAGQDTSAKANVHPSQPGHSGQPAQPDNPQQPGKGRACTTRPAAPASAGAGAGAHVKAEAEAAVEALLRHPARLLTPQEPDRSGINLSGSGAGTLRLSPAGTSAQGSADTSAQSQTQAQAGLGRHQVNAGLEGTTEASVGGGTSGGTSGASARGHGSLGAFLGIR